jgi:sarcosine oxidase subunit beta
MLPRTADVVIIGGGVMGTSTAYHLASRGCRDVVLIEREEFLSMGSTGRCAGGIRYQFSTEINIRLSLISLEMLDRFKDEMEQDISLNYCGYLFLLTREDEMTVFGRDVELQHRLGIDTKMLTPDDIHRMVPLLNMDGIIGGTLYERDGLADPPGVVQGYAKQAGHLGAKILTGVAATDIKVDKGRVQSVVTTQGEIATPMVVNATGPWAAQVGRWVGIDLPVLPVRRQISVTAPIPAIPHDFPFTIEFTRSLYFHRESGGILTGMSNPDEPPGFDQSVDKEWRVKHLTAAAERLPILEEAQILSDWAGLYEVSPDAHPILGRIADIEGFVVITGFSGHGFMHGPVTGLLMAEEILDGKAHTLDIAPLRFDRFQRGEGEAERRVV